MRILYIFIVLGLLPLVLSAQDLVIEEGEGIVALRIGQSYEAVQNIVGFHGELKTYENYLAEELFNEEPEDFLECVIGFDYYVKFEHLLTLPVSYVFFKDDKVNQIMVSSFPVYYFAIAKNTTTSKGLRFWEDENKMIELYDVADLRVNHENFILDSYFYFRKGIAFNLRDNLVRSSHIYAVPDKEITDKFSDRFR